MPWTREDSHRVAAGVRRDEVLPLVREYESVLARERIGRGASARGAETASRVATGERDRAIARLAVTEHAVAGARVRFDEEAHCADPCSPKNHAVSPRSALVENTATPSSERQHARARRTK